jgi:hypothetical protein
MGLRHEEYGVRKTSVCTVFCTQGNGVKRIKPAFSMESGVVHDNYGLFVKGWQKTLLKSILTQSTVHSAVILQGRGYPSIRLRGNNAHSLVFFTADNFSFRGISVLPVQIGIYSGFI